MILDKIKAFFRDYWWFFYLLLTITVFFIDIQWGIVLALVFCGLIVGITLLKRMGKAKISKNLLGIDKISERELSGITGSYVEKVHAFLHDVSRNPDASGIAILVKGEYIYFSNKVIKKFKLKYKDGMGMKEIIASMEQIETRDEYKKILQRLEEFDELPERAKSTKE